MEKSVRSREVGEIGEYLGDLGRSGEIWEIWGEIDLHEDPAVDEAQHHAKDTRHHGRRLVALHDDAHDAGEEPREGERR